MIEFEKLAGRRWSNKYTAGSKLLEVDFTGRQENFDEDIRDVFRTLGISSRELPAASTHRNRPQYSTCCTHESRSMIEDMYRSDIQLFGHKSEDTRV